MKLFKVGRTDGGFESGIEMALETILVSPNFLFRLEREPAKSGAGRRPIASAIWTSASQHSSFFCGVPYPDDQLLDLAIRGKLRDHDAYWSSRCSGCLPIPDQKRW